jgi:hypothetical protein
MSGFIPPLLIYAFMAWCSVKKKAQGQLYIYFKIKLITLDSRYIDACVLKK